MHLLNWLHGINRVDKIFCHLSLIHWNCWKNSPSCSCKRKNSLPCTYIFSIQYFYRRLCHKHAVIKCQPALKPHLKMCPVRSLQISKNRFRIKAENWKMCNEKEQFNFTQTRTSCSHHVSPPPPPWPVQCLCVLRVLYLSSCSFFLDEW